MSEPEVTIRAWESGQVIDVEYCDENGSRVEEFQGFIRIRDALTGLDVYGRAYEPSIGSFGNITVDHVPCHPFTMTYGNVRNMGPKPEVQYGDNMAGMTLDEFQAWSDQVIREVKGRNKG